MPIYAYKCSACGHAEDKLQKISDAPLTVCPQCNQTTYSKQVTAAGFQLKGSGWYVTDFRSNGSGAAKTNEAAVPVAGAEAGGGSATPSDSGSAKAGSGDAAASGASASSSEGSASSASTSATSPAASSTASSGAAAPTSSGKS